MTCTNCHAPIEPGELYCPNCHRAEITAAEAAAIESAKLKGPTMPTTVSTFDEIVNCHRAHKLAMGHAECKADIERHRLSMVAELRVAKTQLALALADLREADARADDLAAQVADCTRWTARWCAACLAVGVAIGVLAATFA